MHPSPSFRIDDAAELTALVAARGFCLILGAAERRVVVAHAPVVLNGHRLHFHLSRGNPLVATLRAQAHGLAVASLEDAYISPDWYAAPDQVPTWNYRSVEMEGAIRDLDRDETIDLLAALSAQFEARLAPKAPWTRAKMSALVFDRLVDGIAGFEMTVRRFQGVSKLSQNKPPDEIARVAAALRARPDAGSRQIADLMTPRRS